MHPDEYSVLWEIEDEITYLSKSSKDRQLKWDKRFLELAKFISSWSKDPSTKVGAVISDKDNRIVSVGYNGLPQGIIDDEATLNNRELKLKSMIHAEENAVLFAQRTLKKCNIYIWPFLSCSKCTSLLIQSKIGRVITIKNDTPRWAEDFKISKQLYKQAKIDVIELEL